MKKKILIAEDDKILQGVMKNTLEGKNYEVIQAFDGENCLEKVKLEKPDIILLDLILPKKDGYHVLLEINKDKNLKKIPVIIITVIDSAASKKECKNYGANDYIIKSRLTIQEIEEKIEKLLK